MNAHYKSLVNLPVSSLTTSELHHAYVDIEKHLRSLEAINQDVESLLLITMLLSKLFQKRKVILMIGLWL